MTAFGRSRRLLAWLFRHRGLRTVAHLLRPHLPRRECVLVHDFDGDLKFHCYLDEHIGSFMFWRGAYSWRQLQVLERLLEASMTFLDVGANQGEFSLFAAKRLVGGRVVAFEPTPTMFERLQRNIAANGFTNIEARRLGLWEHAGRRTIYLPHARFTDGCRHEGLATLFPSEGRGAATAEVELARLDDVVRDLGLDRVHVVKIDVEGAELGVVRGGLETIQRWRPVLFLEADAEMARNAGASLEELFGLLQPWYRFELIRSTGRTRPIDPTTITGHEDVLCLPR